MEEASTLQEVKKKKKKEELLVFLFFGPLGTFGLNKVVYLRGTLEKIGIEISQI